MKRNREEPPAPDDEEDLASAEPDLAPPPEAEYRRRRQPVPVRRRRGSSVWRWLRDHHRPVIALVAILVVALGGTAFLFQSSWFVLDGSDAITVTGAAHADTTAIKDVFAGDFGRNLFFIPIEPRRQALLALPWIASAEVLRVLPNRLQIRIHERTPVALARAGDGLALVDAHGVILPRPAASDYNFPILSGLAGADQPVPDTLALVAERVPQIHLYLAWRDGLDHDQPQASAAFSEVDVHDSSDLQARVSLPGGNTTLIHFGDRNFAARYALFESQVATWQQKYPTMVSVDLHYDGEAIVDPGNPAPGAPALKSPVKPVKHPPR